MLLNNHKIIEVSNITITLNVIGREFYLTVDSKNEEICTTIKEEDIILHYKDKYYLMKNFSFSFSSKLEMENTYDVYFHTPTEFYSIPIIQMDITRKVKIYNLLENESSKEIKD